MKVCRTATRISKRWKVLLSVCLATAVPQTVRAQFQLDIEQVADAAFPHVEEVYEPPQSENGRVRVLGGIDIARNIERWMFGQHQTEAKARVHMENQLKLAIESIDRDCELTVDQKEKLQLAGAGDITLFFAECDKIRAEFDGAAQQRNELNQLMQRIQPLQQRMRGSLFGRGSIFERVSDQLLEPTQRNRLKRIEDERLRFFFEATLKSAIAKAERATPLRALQREKLMQLVKDAAGPKLRGRHMPSFAIYSLAKLQPQLGEILDKEQLAAMAPLLRKGRNMERILKQQGYID